MLSRRTLGVAGAAILGSAALLTTNTANAVINLTPATGEMAGKVKIAGETLLMGTAFTTTVGGVTYYDVTNRAPTPRYTGGPRNPGGWCGVL